MKRKYLNLKIGVLAIVLCCCGCKKFIEVSSPVTSVNSGNVYSNDNTAISVLTGMYGNMIPTIQGDGSIMAISKFADLSADNLALYDMTNATYLPYYQNNLSGVVATSNPSIFWQVCYQQIYVANAAIEGISASSTLTPAIKQQLLGEARFFRAFYFFYLVNLYGDVPLTLTTDYKVNSQMGRTPKASVYEQIVTDLKAAQALLNDNYLDAGLRNVTTERIRANKAAATAMLARVYLYTVDYSDAEASATQVINNNAYALVDLNSVFLKNSQETIWSLQPTQYNLNTWEGYYLQLPSTGPTFLYTLYLSNQLISNFENGDQRFQKWTGNVTANGTTYYYPYKYKIGRNVSAVTEYEMVLRLGEQYLIRAEARAQQGNITGAQADLNAIRNRAGLPGTTANDKPSLLTAILHERQVELFTEWGHRWLDLKRTGQVDAVMSVVCPLKGGTWAPYKALYPILQTEIDKDPGMKGQQNPGY